MNGKPSAKFIIVMNLIMDIPMAVVMSIMGPILAKQPVITPLFPINCLIGFALAFFINAVFPISAISAKFAGLFKVKRHSFVENIIGNIPAAAIFVFIIGFVMNVFDVFIMAKQPFLNAMMAWVFTFVPMWLVCWIIACIFVPIALRCALATDGKSIADMQ
ncbi:MAG: hypothetical protein K5851_02795 [Lachnospiraceae bacterium]|nr:hypothetical protein [Lachnospiraceae bacterium]